MSIKEFKLYFSNLLKDTYPTTEIDSFFFILMEEFLDFKRIDTVMKADITIPSDVFSLLKKSTERLLKEEPIQYILGKTEFYDVPFLVDKNTLIPRPETEELVDWILIEVKETREKNKETRRKTQDVRYKTKERKLHVLDIGTGTGCIPIALAKNVSNATISAIDISKKALEIAQKNAQLNEVAVSFFEADILKIDSFNEITSSQTPRNDKGNVIAKNHVIASATKQSLSKNEITTSQTPRNDVKFDLIVSNPPYVRELEKTEINNNVLQNEPHIALFVSDENPLLFYNKIADLAKNHLTKNGLLFFEINQYLGKETVNMLAEKGFKNITLKKDFSGNDRMIKANI